MADIWKKNTLEDLEGGLLEYETAGDFGRYKERVWKRRGEVNKSSRTKEAVVRRMEEFVQEFRRTARESGYEGRLLVKEFKRGINSTICQRLIELEQQPSSIEQWYD